jgi:hypothetical protein
MPKAKPKHVRGKRVCIFCARDRKITKEHVFGIWLKDLFPRDEYTRHRTIKITWPDKNGRQPSIESSSLEQGHVGSQKLRVVCQVCNNERLGGLEDRAKKALPPLIIGRRANILPGGQALLATWATKTAMVAEYFRPVKDGITQPERSWLIDNLLPPPKWFVWIGAYSGLKWRNLAIYQSRMRLSDTPVRRPSEAPYYAQATTFGVGHILFCVISSSSPLIERFAGREAEGLFQIWPPRLRSILWPPRRILNDNDADAIANLIEHSGVFDHSLDPGADWTFAL